MALGMAGIFIVMAMFFLIIFGLQKLFPPKNGNA
jgi:hypothetical protein